MLFRSPETFCNAINLKQQPKVKLSAAVLRCGTPERTLTSDLSLRRRLLYTTELLRHMNGADSLIHNEVILSNFRDAVKTVGAN